MALIDDVRTCLRVTSELTDVEIQMWINAAIADMSRCGVKSDLLVEETMNSLVKSAVVCFVKGQYGYDNSEAPRFLDSYRLMLAALLNSSSNEYLYPEEEDDSSDDSTDDSSDESSESTDDSTEESTESEDVSG